MKRTLLLLGAFLVLTGCGLAERALEALPEGAREAVAGAVQSRRWSLQEPIDAFFAAVDARDAAAVKALFSPNAQAADEALDADIQALFDLYPGPTEDCAMTRPAGASKHIGWGENAATVHNTFPVVCQGVSYYCALSYTTKDEADEGNVGLRSVVFVTEKVQANEDFLDSLDRGPGLTVAADCPGDYETRRIGDRPYVFTPMDRSLAPEDLADFLGAQRDWEAFQERFGAPNAESWPSSYYYELLPQDGQPRYAHILLHTENEAEQVYSAYLYDAHDYQPIGVIWNAEEK